MKIFSAFALIAASLTVVSADQKTVTVTLPVVVKAEKAAVVQSKIEEATLNADIAKKAVEQVAEAEKVTITKVTVEKTDGGTRMLEAATSGTVYSATGWLACGESTDAEQICSNQFVTLTGGDGDISQKVDDCPYETFPWLYKEGDQCTFLIYRYVFSLSATGTGVTFDPSIDLDEKFKRVIESEVQSKIDDPDFGAMSGGAASQALHTLIAGDPHFKTLGGQWYDYMGACDLKMIHAPKFDGEAPLDVNVRTKIRYDYSYVESAVLKLGNDTLEVASYGDYFLNGVAGAQMPAFVGGYPVTHSAPSKKIHKFTIQISDRESITMKNFKDMVSISLDVLAPRFEGALGMVGSADNHGKLLGRDGKTLFEDPSAFADEWQIRADEPMLFSAAKGPQAPEKCQLPSPAEAKGRRLGETIALEAAEKACAKWAAENKDACVHDVMAIGDLELAAAGAF